MRLVVDSVPSMLAYWDRSQRCVFANRAYTTWFGIAPELIVGRTMEQLLGPLYKLNLPYIEAALRGEPQQFEREIPDPAGGPSRQSLAVYTPHIEDGVVRGFTVVVSDINALKRTEAELRSALNDVKALTGLLPVCAWCRKVRDDAGYWSSLEQFLVAHGGAKISHGICEACDAKLAAEDS